MTSLPGIFLCGSNVACGENHSKSDSCRVQRAAHALYAPVCFGHLYSVLGSHWRVPRAAYRRARQCVFPLRFSITFCNNFQSVAIFAATLCFCSSQRFFAAAGFCICSSMLQWHPNLQEHQVFCMQQLPAACCMSASAFSLHSQGGASGQLHHTLSPYQWARRIFSQNLHICQDIWGQPSAAKRKNFAHDLVAGTLP